MPSKQTITNTLHRIAPRIIAGIVCMLLAGYGGIASSSGQAESTRLVANVEQADNSDPSTRLPESSPPAVCGKADLSKLKNPIYVSPQGSDSGTCGTSVAGACGTIQQGIKQCSGVTGCGVLVAHGLYPLINTLVLAEGVSVYGSCAFDSVTGNNYRSVLQAPADGKLAISATNINTATTLYGFQVLGSDATTPGQASIAMTVSTSKGLTISHTVLASGRGAEGKGGNTPTSKRGNNGDNAVSDSDAAGKGGPACRGLSSPGGAGGDGAPRRFNTLKLNDWIGHTCVARGGSSGKTGFASGSSKGGAGGPYGRNGDACSNDRWARLAEDGQDGTPGNWGDCGVQGGKVNSNVWGVFDKTGWHPNVAGGGDSGKNGSGGGGGGAGGLSAIYTFPTTWHSYSGMPGGGGGGGGCGGSGGEGGQQGGASVPLVLVASSVLFDNISIVPGPSGQGGTGGKGVTGGMGGYGGAGAKKKHGDDGGAGGTGGDGGGGGLGGASAGGAGGNGGPSIGIALVEGSQAPPSKNGIYAGIPGAPGLKGQGGKNILPRQCRGADGTDGMPGGTKAWHVF